jgi:hypothetical protein
MKKFICLGILVLMTVVCVVPACAAGETTNRTQGVITPQWTYISLLSPGPINQLVGKSHLYGACLSLRQFAHNKAYCRTAKIRRE